MSKAPQKFAAEVNPQLIFNYVVSLIKRHQSASEHLSEEKNITFREYLIKKITQDYHTPLSQNASNHIDKFIHEHVTALRAGTPDPFTIWGLIILENLTVKRLYKQVLRGCHFGIPVGLTLPAQAILKQFFANTKAIPQLIINSERPAYWLTKQMLTLGILPKLPRAEDPQQKILLNLQKEQEKLGDWWLINSGSVTQDLVLYRYGEENLHMPMRVVEIAKVRALIAKQKDYQTIRILLTERDPEILYEKMQHAALMGLSPILKESITISQPIVVSANNLVHVIHILTDLISQGIVVKLSTETDQYGQTTADNFAALLKQGTQTVSLETHVIENIVLGMKQCFALGLFPIVTLQQQRQVQSWLDAHDEQKFCEITAFQGDSLHRLVELASHCGFVSTISLQAQAVKYAQLKACKYNKHPMPHLLIYPSVKMHHLWDSDKVFIDVPATLTRALQAVKQGFYIQYTPEVVLLLSEHCQNDVALKRLSETIMQLNKRNLLAFEQATEGQLEIKGRVLAHQATQRNK